MRKVFILLLTFLYFELTFSQGAIQIDLINKSVNSNVWNFTVQATALPSYTGDYNNWSSMNIRFDLLLPTGVTVTTVSGTLLSGVPSGMTGAFQNSVPGLPTNQNPNYNSEFGLFFDRSISVPDLIIGVPQIWGTIGVTFSNNVNNADIYDQRDVLGTAGSFYVTMEEPSIQRSFASQGPKTLPIKLLNFEVEKVQNDVASLLTWSTSSEINSDYFNIERSLDGNKWETIGKVDAAGNSNRQNNYKFLDENLKLDREENIFFYRLKMLDLDGEYKYSEIRNILFANDKNIVQVFPNPTKDVFNLDLSVLDNNKGEITIIVIDQAGRNVLVKKEVDNSLQTISLKDLPVGNYNVIVKQNEDVYLNKIVKIK